MEPTVYHGTVSSVNGVMRVVADGTVVTPSSGKDGYSVTADTVVDMVSHGGIVVDGGIFSKAHLSVLLPRSNVHLKELLASLPSRNVMVA